MHWNSSSGDEGPSAFSTILPNKEGKDYSMEEVFQVWKHNEPKIMNSINKKISADNQEYMHEHAKPIYHLDLQVRNKNTPPPKQGDSNISAQFSGLSMNESISLENAYASSQPKDEQGGSFDPVVPPLKDEFFTSPLSNEWFYIDPSGNEQGPFNGNVMQEWFMSGYLALDLNVRRKNEPLYQTLRQVCESQNNFTTPFATSLLDMFSLHEVMTPSHDIKPTVGVQNQLDPFFDENASGVASPSINMNSLASQPSFFGNNILGQSEGSLSNPVGAGATFSGPRQTPFENVATGVNYSGNFSNSLPQMNQFNSLLQQQGGGLLSQNHNGWNIDDPAALMGAVPENSTSIPQPLSNISPQHPMSSFLSGVHTQSPVGSPFAPGSSIVSNDGFRDIEVNQQVNSLNQAPEENLFHHLQNSMMTDLLNENVNDKSVSDAKVPCAEDLKTTADEDDKSRDVSTSFGDMRQNQTNKKREVLQNELKPTNAVGEQEIASAKVNTSSTPTAPTSSSKAPKDEVLSSKISNNKKPSTKKQVKEEKNTNAENHTPSITTSSTTPYAPWANATADAQERQSKPSMTLKDIQNLEVERAKEQQHIEDTIRKEQLLKESKEKSQSSTPKSSLPKTSSWGGNNNSKAPVVTKTLGEIQKEEAKAREQTKASTPSTASQPASFAAALANSKPRVDESWTFVAPKKTVQKKPSQVNVSTSTATAPKSTSSPQYLRSVSATAPASTNVNSSLIMEDFLSWARSSMANLYPTVSKEGLLDVFVALPLNKDSSLIIAESIYGSSTTMDGRRFAAEFLKRRQKLENQIGHQDARTWSSAIQSSAVKLPTVDEEGWSTSWKAGKKGKKA